MTVGMFIVLPLALIGHGSLWLLFWNHVHGTSMPKALMKGLDRVAKFNCIFGPFCLLSIALQNTDPIVSGLLTAYIATCFAVACVCIPNYWLRRRDKLSTERAQCTKSTIHFRRESQQESVQQESPGFSVLKLPINQSFEIEESDKELSINNLPLSCEGLSIAHLSDLHFTGRVARSYFDYAVDRVNAMQPDIVAITGDLVDRPEYNSWLPLTLGRLCAPHGVYAILGNHDTKNNLTRLRMLLSEIGIVNLGGRFVQRKVNGHTIVLAGNELPWIVPAANMTHCATRDELSQTRILLAHTPDQIHWARANDFDLMLAGHTHGGQFCLPGFGPFVSPSRSSLQYATGAVYEAPTLLHVSRGLSGEWPLRLNCRPEISKLTLKSVRKKQVGRVSAATHQQLKSELLAT